MKEIEELKQRIAASGLTATAIAKKAGVSRQIVRNISLGVAENVTLTTFHAIRNALKRGGGQQTKTGVRE